MCYLKKANIKIGDNHFLFSPIRFDKAKKIHVLDNSKLSYLSYREIIKKAVAGIGLDPKDYGTHSCRSGGATDIAPHISQYELLLSGRWADPRSVGSYVETPEDRRYAISKSMNMNFQ